MWAGSAAFASLVVRRLAADDEWRSVIPTTVEEAPPTDFEDHLTRMA